MRKSEHTELASLSRLAVFVSVNGLHQLSYGSASSAAHLSRGALQRIFPDKFAMEDAVIEHTTRLINSHLFQYERTEASDVVANAMTSDQQLEECLQRWAQWISGDAGLPGGCILLAICASRGYRDDLNRKVDAALTQILQQLSALASAARRIDESARPAFENHLWSQALWLHTQQFRPSGHPAVSSSENIDAFLTSTSHWRT